MAGSRSRGRAALSAAFVMSCVACSERPPEAQRAELVLESDYVVIAPALLGAAAEDTLFAAAPGHRTLYANRWGGTYQNGWDDASSNRSSVISGSRSISAFAGGDARWQTLMTCLRGEFERWNVTVTDQDPGSAPHIEAVIGGNSGQIGMGAIGGLAPLTGDCSVVERAVVYVFEQNLNPGDNTCEVAAHEIGHALGLDHEHLCQDPMTYLYGCEHKTFQDSAQWCGEYSARACRCSQKQNTVAHLNLRLGFATGSPTPTPVPTPAPDPAGSTPPVVFAVSPIHDVSLTGNVAVSVSASVDDADGDLSSTVLWWWRDGNWTSFSCETPPSYVTCGADNGTYTWTFGVGTGTRWWLVRATDAAGNQVDSAMRSVRFQP